jgi:antitoxin component YwqK of YwqJK toxin-antitoxin module
MKPTFISLVLISIACSMCDSKRVDAPPAAVVKTDSIISSKEEVIKPIAVSDLKEGDNLKRYDNGVKQYEGAVKNGKREGKWAYWYNNGSPWSECEYKEGRKDGRTTVWYENGYKRYEGFYKDDERSGKWTYWDEKGNPVKELTY